MPKLRRLNGKQVIGIFGKFGFEVDRIKGSHHHLVRITDDKPERITVPVHGKKAIALPTLRQIYRDGCKYISEDELKEHFYTEN